jgi:small-conductance mechanosensitive channel
MKTAMRPMKAALAAALSAALAAPSSAQMAAAAAGADAARVPVLAPLPLAALAPSLSLGAPLTVPALAAPSAPSAGLARPAVALSAALPSALAAESASPAAAAAPEAGAETAPIVPAAEAATDPTTPASGRTSAAAPALAAAAALPAPTDDAARGRWERFWTGAAALGAAAVPAAFFTPVLGGVKAAASHLAPALGAAGVLGGAYAADHGVRWAISRYSAKRGLDEHQQAAARLVSRVTLWTGAIYAALAVGGASPQVLATVLGAGGTVLTLSLSDVLGNVIQGVSFLVARPFTIGDSVQIDDQAGRVTDLSLAGLVLTRDDGAEVKVRHSTLAAKAVIVFGPFAESAGLHLALPRRAPRLDGAARAVWTSLDRGFWVSAALFAGFVAAPSFVGALATGWPAVLVHAALAGSLLWLTRRVERAVVAAVEVLAESNGWRLESRVVARVIARVAAWGIGGGAFLRVVGLSWTALGASIGLTTVGVGLAANNFFRSVVIAAEVLFTKPFHVGDRLQIGANAGVVRDITFSHVVIQLDENRRLYAPYAVIRDAVLVVQKPGSPTK